MGASELVEQRVLDTDHCHHARHPPKRPASTIAPQHHHQFFHRNYFYFRQSLTLTTDSRSAKPTEVDLVSARQKAPRFPGIR